MKLTVCCVLVAFMSVMLVSVQANSIAVRSIGKFQLNDSNFHRFKMQICFQFLEGRAEVVTVATTTTTRDWVEVCADLCKTGDGGVLCNCELVPVRRR
jgi:hypothetical protein